MQMRAIAQAMDVLRAWIGRLLTRCLVRLEKLSASEPAPAFLRSYFVFLLSPTTRTAALPLALSCLALVILLVGCAAPAPPPPPPPPPPPAERPQPSAAEAEALKRVRFEDTAQGARAVLDDSILFEFGKSDLAPSADLVLDALRPALARARGVIIVEGHTDSVGSDAFNLELSKRRAERVRDALIKRQVPPERVRAVGLGSTSPRVKPERSDEDRRLNRRAEFLFPDETVASLDGRAADSTRQTSLGALGGTLKSTSDQVGSQAKGAEVAAPAAARKSGN